MRIANPRFPLVAQSFASKRAIMGALTLAAVFFSFSVGSRSISVLLSLTGVTLAASILGNLDLKYCLRALISPFSALALAIAGASIFATDAIASKVLLGVSLTYLFARLARAVFPLSWLLGGVAINGFIVGLLGEFGKTAMAEMIPLIGLLVSNLGKNQTGWTLAFGIVAAVTLAFRLQKHYALRSVNLIMVIGYAALILASDSVTAGLAAGFALLLIPVAAVGLRFFKLAMTRAYLLPLWLSAIVGGTLIVVPAVLNVFRDFFSPKTGGYNLRSFTELTGRDKIWGCYRSSGLDSAADLLTETSHCVESLGAPGIGHLHSIYYETHLLMGWLGVTLLFAGFGFVAAVTLVLIRKAASVEGFLGGLFSLGVLVVGSLVGVTESFLYHKLVFGAFVFFLGAPVSLHFGLRPVLSSQIRAKMRTIFRGMRAPRLVKKSSRKF
ncbi:hypothetical protein N8964_00710 [Pontimonas sp.]|nr:hypothetical protein [Pontimonas sp.]